MALHAKHPPMLVIIYAKYEEHPPRTVGVIKSTRLDEQFFRTSLCKVKRMNDLRHLHKSLRAAHPHHLCQICKRSIENMCSILTFYCEVMSECQWLWSGISQGQNSLYMAHPFMPYMEKELHSELYALYRADMTKVYTFLLFYCKVMVEWPGGYNFARLYYKTGRIMVYFSGSHYRLLIPWVSITHLDQLHCI